MKPTIAFIRREIKRMDPNLNEEDSSFKAAVVLMASSVVGPNVDRVHRFSKSVTKVNRAFVRDLARKLRKNAVWVNDKIHCEWFEKEHGAIAFWLDVGVATGMIKKTTKDDRYYAKGAK